MEPLGGLEDPQVMRNWIRTVQRWIEDNSSRQEGRKASDEYITSVEHGDLDSAV